MSKRVKMDINYAKLVLEEPSVFRKIDLFRKYAFSILEQKKPLIISQENLPARDIQVLHPKYHPPKSGFSTPAGQARMLHDLASIELQAMELGLRTLAEFTTAPVVFKEELLNIALSEANHLEMCLIEIEKLRHKWGDWPIHLSLWKTTSKEDSLLDRILIVHRYLEGSGLDAGDTLFRRLQLIDCPSVKKAVHQITFEEIGHVEFGSRWYRTLCQQENLNPADDYAFRMNRLIKILPKRLEPIAINLRREAGFTDQELDYLQDLRKKRLTQ